MSILRSKVSSLFAVLLCAYVSPGYWMTASGHQMSNQDTSIMLVAGLCYGTFVAASFAAKSSFVGDRFTFGLIAAAFAANVVAKLTAPLSVAHSPAL
jgi:hypothetical protein